jgi:Na+-translocating ferredoxin:NAD+ oxidoreductase RnfA subunit
MPGSGKLDRADSPSLMKGTSLVHMVGVILSMAFMGFAGMGG